MHIILHKNRAYDANGARRSRRAPHSADQNCSLSIISWVTMDSGEAPRAKSL